MIRLRHLQKSFGEQSVLRGVSLEVPTGEFLALIGMSGSGKSLLLKQIVGLVAPDGGSVEVAGQEVGKLSQRQLKTLRAKIGYLFQNGALFDSLTVFENVAFPLREKTHMRAAEIRKLVHEELELVGLANAAEKYPAQISGGMIKRAALARTLVQAPEIILFDEPTAGLDPIVAKQMLALFAEIHRARNLTGILVSHEIPEIFSIVEKIAMLHEGEIISVETPATIRESQNPVLQQFINATPQGPIHYR